MSELEKICITSLTRYFGPPTLAACQCSLQVAMYPGYSLKHTVLQPDMHAVVCAGASQQSPDMGTAQGQKSPAGHAAVLQLLQTIGAAYSLLSKYHCQVQYRLHVRHPVYEGTSIMSRYRQPKRRHTKVANHG